MSAPLSKDQKRYLSQLAHRAMLRQSALARGRGELFEGGIYEQLTASAGEDKFRQAQVAKACGKNGLRCCSQDDYRIVEAHFLELLGESGKAMHSLVLHQSNARRVAQFKLTQACTQAGVKLGYADAICRNTFKCSLDDASEDQLWKLMFTIKNRGRKVTFKQ